MAAQGRGGAAAAASAVVVGAGAVLLCLLVAGTGTAAAMTQAPRPPTKYVVGDGAGWRRGLDRWPDGKTFYAGDVLVFKYDKEKHDVAVVGGKGYQRCKPGHNTHASYVMNTGNDEVRLRMGNNYFICSKPGHCDNTTNSMKLHVVAW